MKFAFTFRIALLNERTPARCGRLARIQRLARLGFRNASARSLGAHGTLPGTTSTAATWALGKTRRRSAGARCTGTPLARSAPRTGLSRSRRSKSLRRATLACSRRSARTCWISLTRRWCAGGPMGAGRCGRAVSWGTSLSRSGARRCRSRSCRRWRASWRYHTRPQRPSRWRCAGRRNSGLRRRRCCFRCWMSSSWRNRRRAGSSRARGTSRRRNNSRTSGNRCGRPSNRRYGRRTGRSRWRSSKWSRRFRFRRCSLRLLCFNRSFLGCQTEKMLPHQLSVRIINRA